MKFFIKTYGCQMNEYDSDVIRKQLKNLKIEESDNYEDSQVIIINTCNIREKAAQKLYSELGRIVRQKTENKQKQGINTVIAVIGCVAQAEGKIIFERSKLVDIVCGPQMYHKFGQMVENAFKEQEKQDEQDIKKQIELEFKTNQKFDFLDEEAHLEAPQQGRPSAFITIQEGCDRFCTFCVVPYTRGPEVSRNPNKILDEVKKLRDSGTKEVVLLGQNVNAFLGTNNKGEKCNLAQLISLIAEIEGIERIRYTTSHPAYINKDLFAVHGSEEKLMPLLNLPVQSGSDKILKAMNRKHTYEQYIEIMKKMKKMRPNIIFSSDFIVGFPGETDEDFEQTCKLIKEVGFQAQSYAFKYSPRTGTPAEFMEQMDEEIKSSRLAIIQDLLENQRMEYNKTFQDQTLDVLIDQKKLKQPDQIGGRTEFHQIAIIRNLTEEQKQNLYGKIVKVKVKELNSNSFICELV